MTADELYRKGQYLYYRNQAKEEGIALLKSACQLGDARADVILGLHYLELGDYQTANVYFEHGATKHEPTCLRFLADAYGSGKGKISDPVKAYELILEAIAQGESVDPSILSIYKREADEAQKKGFLGRLLGRR